MARPRQDEPSFGSDSFLDVVCNVVGILVILMVVVGVRASRAPVASSRQVAPEIDMAAPRAERVSPYVPVAAALEMEDVPLPPMQAPAAPPDLVAAAGQAERDSQQARSELSLAQTRLREMQAALLQRQAQAAQLQRQLDEAEQMTARGGSNVALFQQDLEERRRLVNQLEAGVDRLKSVEPAVGTIQHQLTPMSREVSGEEIHFRLSNNRVSQIPVELLVREVQHDMQKRKDILVARNFFRGSTRTVQGYQMEYILQREALSVTDEMRMGAGMMRIAVSGWIITPTTELRDESLAESRQAESRFRGALRAHGTNATVTFWVYPDSFDLHRELSSVVREQGYWVASRPLPEGVPIAGSPQGSKSLAQ